jgi:hypothetical protein
MGEGRKEDPGKSRNFFFTLAVWGWWVGTGLFE